MADPFSQMRQALIGRETRSAKDDFTISYVRLGVGARTIVLIHGWPQAAYAWRRVIPQLSSSNTVVAMDLRGVGGTTVTAQGYDKETLASDVKALVDHLGLRNVVVVGSDVGAMVAYAYARSFPQQTDGVVLVDMPLPGIQGWDIAASSYPSWHLGFHRDMNRSVGVAETVIAGRQEFYFRSFIDRFAAYPESISDADIAVYAAAYSDGPRLKAGFDLFRMLPVDIDVNERRNGRLAVPIMLAFAEYSYATLLETVARGLRAAGVEDVRSTVLIDSGHWPAEEQPGNLAELVLMFARGLHV